MKPTGCCICFIDFTSVHCKKISNFLMIINWGAWNIPSMNCQLKLNKYFWICSFFINSFFISVHIGHSSTSFRLSTPAYAQKNRCYMYICIVFSEQRLRPSLCRSCTIDTITIRKPTHWPLIVTDCMGTRTLYFSLSRWYIQLIRKCHRTMAV